MDILIDTLVQHLAHLGEEIGAYAIAKRTLLDVNVQSRIDARFHPQCGEQAVAQFLYREFPVIDALHLLQTVHQFHKARDVACPT